MALVWYILLAVAAAIFLVASYKIFGIDKVKNWLLWAVINAESEFGSGTGKLKLAMVYDMFIEKFPKLQAIIPYNVFSKLVDTALEHMRELLKNDKILSYVNKTE